MFRNDHGSTIVAIVIIVFILNLTFAVFYYTSSNTTQKTGLSKSKTTALNVAEAGKERLYGEIRWGIYKPKNYKESVYNLHPFENGKFSVTCSSTTNLDTIWVTSSGFVHDLISKISVVAEFLPDFIIPFPPVKGAITARNSIIVKGNIEVDGRDYDSTGILAGNGVYGVSTSGYLSVEGSSTVGGNGELPVDKKLIDSLRGIVSEEHMPVSASLSSPEAFLGLPHGALDSYKINNLNTPFQGLVYLTQDYVGPVHFGESEGILIVHNAYKSAELQITDGKFKGLIICDRMAKISGNAEILGAVVTLTDGEVSTFGTGTATIKYSSQVLASLNSYCKNLMKKVSEISWKEL